jgi:hypothetical protein
MEGVRNTGWEGIFKFKKRWNERGEEVEGSTVDKINS